MSPPSQSPLPDSSALEAGLVADTRQPVHGAIQNDVRNLLLDVPLSGRLVYSDVLRSPDAVRTFDDDIKCRSIFEEYATTEEKVPSPKVEGTYAPSLLEYYSRSPGIDLETGVVVFPSQCRQRKEIPTIAYRRRTKRRRGSDRDARVLVLACIGLTTFLSALVAGYISQVVQSKTLHPALHVVFTVSIFVTTILLAYYTARVTSRTSIPRHLWAVRRPRYRHHRHHHRRRWPSTPSTSASLNSKSGLLRTPSVLRPSPTSTTPKRLSPSLPHTPLKPEEVLPLIPHDLLPTPPAARTARHSTQASHSTYLGEYSDFYVKDMKPLPSRPPLTNSPVRSPVGMTQLPPVPPLNVRRAATPPTERPTRTTRPVSPASLDPLPAITCPTPLSPLHTPLSPTGTPGSPVIVEEADEEQDEEEQHEREEGSIYISAPPPAYGRWRGSIRVDPDFLGWRQLSLEEVEGRGLPGYSRGEDDGV
ncbi:DNA polymerase epsilon subunit C [Sphaceloma murrayae]|uniref:DNA polymerase epsilon subunit C n=1 Tax=Sphaceloma murrayae TaxID=2082308 RepID=A0A2K1R369_9PEZI|nr:DNA polymerase epsilon subunit C [Sphaceloma murrayae]